MKYFQEFLNGFLQIFLKDSFSKGPQTDSPRGFFRDFINDFFQDFSRDLFRDLQGDSFRNVQNSLRDFSDISSETHSRTSSGIFSGMYTRIPANKDVSDHLANV